MKVPPLFILIISITAVISAVCAGPSPSPTPTPRFGMTVIASIMDKQIITETSRIRKIYKITEQTEIYSQGQKVSASDLAPGMRVSVTPKFGEAQTAAVIDAGPISKAITLQK